MVRVFHEHRTLFVTEMVFRARDQHVQYAIFLIAFLVVFQHVRQPHRAAAVTIRPVLMQATDTIRGFIHAAFRTVGKVTHYGHTRRFTITLTASCNASVVRLVCLIWPLLAMIPARPRQGYSASSIPGTSRVRLSLGQ